MNYISIQKVDSELLPLKGSQTRMWSCSVRLAWNTNWKGGLAEAARSVDWTRLVVVLLLILTKGFSPNLQELESDRPQMDVLAGPSRSSLGWPSPLTYTWEYAAFSLSQFASITISGSVRASDVWCTSSESQIRHVLGSVRNWKSIACIKASHVSLLSEVILYWL